MDAGEIKEENNNEPIEEENLTKKMRNNPWIVSTFVFGIVTLIFIIGSFIGNGGDVVSADVAGKNILNFVKSQVGSAELIDVKDRGSFYEVTILSQGQSIPLYVTKDGKYFVQGLIPLNGNSQQNFSQQNFEEPKPQFSDEDNLKIQEFSACLDEKGFRVYAADWCPYCADMKESFGGQENVEPFWIVCSDASRNPTENAELCDKENITGFPTMKLDGEVLEIPRTFEAIAEATGCPAPQLD